MHVWLDFLTKLQKFTSFAYSWSTSEYKILDSLVPDELLAVNTNAGPYQIEYKDSSLVVILRCLKFSTQQLQGKPQEKCRLFSLIL